ncbi:alanine racemase [Parasulfuritortus cantonensis]|uniref:Alanine racemase n=1 Tax=Parasulfuritortus cantonensis TaxID=2528202 RepID=A0A4R1BIK9_9PROT|nr:alanine racemase [Parasulfuritortus cantonensis]TCJ17109.1 alanine racemase [Parasulfuritortus cantonensis]
MRPIVARIDTAALAHNLLVAKRLAGPARVLAVVKANGYGHGLARVGRALRAADGFAVLSLDEAATLRAQGLSHPIVLLEGFFHPDEIAEIARRRLQPVLHREDQVDALARARVDHKIDVFLKLDTGMHRLGLARKPWLAALERLRAIPHVGNITLISHFAQADDPAVGVAGQLATFKEAAQGLAHPVSLAASAALLRYPESHGDWVRPGIMLYGASPFAGETGADIGLLPVMHLESKLIAVQNVRKGEGLGYGHLFTAPRDMRVGVVACGYADGYPRHAVTGTPVLVEGRPSRTLGRVSMDMLCVDLSEIGHAHVGSPVTLWGDGVPIETVAAAAGTISYELLTALAPRVRVEES